MIRIAIFVLIFITFYLPNVQAEKAKVLARVNGEPITEEDLREALELFPEQVRMMVLSNNQMKKRFLENLIAERLLIQQMRKSGIKEDESIKRKVRKYREALLLQKFVEARLSKIKISDKDISEYYKAHIKEFTIPAKVRVRHILVKDEKLAKEILQRIKNGEDFAKLAKQYSMDKASAERGGDIGYITKDQVAKPFADLAFSLKKGEVGGPVKTRFGWHVIKVEDVVPEKVRPLSEVKKEIKEKLLGQKREEMLRSWVEEARKKSKVEIYIK